MLMERWRDEGMGGNIAMAIVLLRINEADKMKKRYIQMDVYDDAETSKQIRLHARTQIV